MFTFAVKIKSRRATRLSGISVQFEERLYSSIIVETRRKMRISRLPGLKIYFV